MVQKWVFPFRPLPKNTDSTRAARMGPGSVEKTRVILPEKSTWLDTTWSSHFLTSYCMFRMMITTTSDMCFFFFVTAFPDDCCGPIERSPPNRSNPGRQRPSGHQVCLCTFDSSMAIEGIAYDAGISEPVDPLFFRPNQGWNMFGHPESLWNCKVNSNIYTFFLLPFSIYCWL